MQRPGYAESAQRRRLRLYKKPQSNALRLFSAQNKEKEPVCAADRLSSIQIIAYRTPVILLMIRMTTEPSSCSASSTILWRVRLRSSLRLVVLGLRAPDVPQYCASEILLQLEMQGLTQMHAALIRFIPFLLFCWMKYAKAIYTVVFTYLLYRKTEFFRKGGFSSKVCCSLFVEKIAIVRSFVCAE